MIGDTVIYIRRNSGWQKCSEPRYPNNNNFLISGHNGDWSGFRSLENCLRQSDESFNKDEVYVVVERF